MEESYLLFPYTLIRIYSLAVYLIRSKINIFQVTLLNRLVSLRPYLVPFSPLYYTLFGLFFSAMLQASEKSIDERERDPTEDMMALNAELNTFTDKVNSASIVVNFHQKKGIY